MIYDVSAKRGEGINQWQALLHDVDNTTLSPKRRGRLLEELMINFFNRVEGFTCVKNIRTRTEELDIEIINNSDMFNREGKIILCECKNWNRPLKRAELNIFIEKMKNRRCRCTLGFLVAWNGVTKDLENELLRFSQRPELVVILEKDGIINALDTNSVREYLDNIVINAITM
ncbi:hypothetical protein GPL15_11865 [Clostridium sp. MCC353]|uniref:restriction endonuclease n=1 Tax=Clostridium sp. MCC353 TaxID=2592646 RepID=UPI001C01E6AF|nr:restriction endonuclease [Clostridium sp. MCC353]MBT9777199.1 hypothetical protein [Clostridium sp. MCC353]